MNSTHEEQSGVMPTYEGVAQVAARRQRIGMTKTELAHEAAISRDTLADMESGSKRPHPDTVAKVLKTLDRIEKEVGLDRASLPPGARYVGDPSQDLVEFTVEGNFGVRAVVKGPIADIEALRKAAADLIAGMTPSKTDEAP